MTSPETEDPRPTAGSETILVVEDDPPFRHVLVQRLRAQGYTVLEAVDGLEALRVGTDYDGPIHLLLIDVVLPRMNGLSVARDMMACRPEMHTIMISGYSQDTLILNSQLNPTIPFFHKSLPLMDLAHKIREVLDHATNLRVNPQD